MSFSNSFLRRRQLTITQYSICGHEFLPSGKLVSSFTNALPVVAQHSSGIDCHCTCSQRFQRPFVVALWSWTVTVSSSLSFTYIRSRFFFSQMQHPAVVFEALLPSVWQFNYSWQKVFPDAFDIKTHNYCIEFSIFPSLGDVTVHPYSLHHCWRPFNEIVFASDPWRGGIPLLRFSCPGLCFLFISGSFTQKWWQLWFFNNFWCTTVSKTFWKSQVCLQSLFYLCDFCSQLGEAEFSFWETMPSCFQQAMFICMLTSLVLPSY